MSRHVMMLRGVPVRVESKGSPDCNKCVFGAASEVCPSAVDERAQGVRPCYKGGHHYVKAESWRAPS